MKSYKKNLGQINSRENYQDAKILRPNEIENTLAPKKHRKNAHKAVASYEEGDLRGIVAKVKAESTNPYRALLESGVIKNAAEFFECSNR